jgi:hypothetical protein
MRGTAMSTELAGKRVAILATDGRHAGRHA